ncbi:TonB-dependent receptor plug domain-containing protein [Wocania ichthyoenteri]|uniref:TonB-dependent receptor plug domain-containing protein n=1 Tax=Wocania ichthyoenteri TaxID=1230531 RepID=UPI00053E65ED|nr:TonB-dependent receptor plug domain-containing protein [Wocania ichthyoenteri]
MKLKFATFIFALIFCAFNANAQKNNKKIVISGFVKDSLSKPVANISIFINDVITNKKTNSDGFYKLKLKKAPKKVMVASSVYGIEEVEYDNKNEINFTFTNNSLNTEKFNYVVFKRKRKTKKTPRVYSSVYDYLRVRLNGVVITSDNKILVRGTTSFNSSTEPLFIVNSSAISSLDGIDPNEIKSATVLKGPECAAYGSRGSNGVIIINTY